MTKGKKVAIFVISVCILFAGVCGSIILTKANAQEGVIIRQYNTQRYTYANIGSNEDNEFVILNIGNNIQYTFYGDETGNITKVEAFSSLGNETFENIYNKKSGNFTFRGIVVSEWDGKEIVGSIENVTNVSGETIDAPFSSYDIEIWVQAFGEFKLQNITGAQVILLAGETEIRTLTTRFYAGQNNYLDIEMNYWAVGEDVDEVIFETRNVLPNEEINSSDIYNQGYNDGIQSQRPIIEQAEQNGYNNGYTAGTAQASNLGDILLGIGGAPVEMIVQMLDFELLGINISNLVMSILTAALCVWVVKMFI